MHKKFFMVTACVLALAAGLGTAATVALAQSTGHQGKKLQRMTQELNLTSAQQAQIQTILQTEKTKIQPLRQQLMQNRLAQTSTVTGAFDEAQVRSFATKQAQIMTELTVEKERTKSQIYAVLTPEQRQQAQAMMQQHHRHRGHHKQMNSQPSATATPE
jgi:protein CpxP